MSFQVNVPPSVVAKMAKTEEELDEDGTAEETTTKKREDWKKLKELEEARKAGTAPAMQDEEGKDINPHIPQYIMQAPWYFGAMQPTLKHQRPQEEKQKLTAQLDQWYKVIIHFVKIDSLVLVILLMSCFYIGTICVICSNHLIKLGFALFT